MNEAKYRRSQQYGSERLEFDIAGGRGFVIQASAAAPGKPWIWYAPTFCDTPGLPNARQSWYFEHLLKAGFAIAGMDVGESWGNPAGRAAFTEFHGFVTTQFGLCRKACLFAQSRGGLMLYNWAVEHPQLVQCVAAVYPVCDVLLAYRAEAICQAFGMTAEELRASQARHSPKLRIAPLAAAGVPIMHIHGTVDDKVPIESNSTELVRNYQQHGGTARLIVVEGKGHEEVAEFFERHELLDFLMTQGHPGR